MPEPITLAEILASYGGWGLSAILMVALVALFRMYNASQQARIDEALEIMRLAIEMRGDNHVTVEALKLLDASHKRHR